MLELSEGGWIMMESAPQQHLPGASHVTPLPPTLDVNRHGKRQQLLQDLLQHSDLLLKNRLEVRHLMTPNPVVIPPTMTVEEMAAMVHERRLHHLLVCNRAGEVLGVISDRDLHAPREATAQQLMSSPVLTVTPDTPPSPAITYLINEHISCLPVVDRGRLCGVLTMTDLVLTLQCMFQLWLRLPQVLEHDTTWSKELDQIAASLGGPLTAEQLSEKIAAARQTIQREIQRLANTIDLRADVLTGMSNRRGLEEVLDMLLAVKRRFGQPFSFAIAAIDRFDQISQTRGEQVAGPLVKALAWLIEKTIRDSDYLARHRDGAFAIVMPQTNLRDAEAICVQLREAAKQAARIDPRLRVRVAAVSPEPNDDVAQLIERAETAVG
jgi:diguanylate cyclase (GGDEF)-like protein